MNTTNKQDETLEVAYSKHKEKYSHFMPDEQSESMLSFSFEEGAKWQKEQDKVIIDKLKFSLTKIVNWYKVQESLSFIDEKDLKESEQLLQSLK